MEKFCAEGYAQIGHYDAFNGTVQSVCASEMLYTPPSESFREVIRDTAIFPACMAKDALGEGLVASLTGYLGQAMTIALEESSALTEEAVNIVLAEIEADVNIALDAYVTATNSALSGLTTGVNATFDGIETSVNSIDAQLNLVDDEIVDGLDNVRSALNRLKSIINALDNSDLLPDFVCESCVNSALSFGNGGILNLNITDLDLAAVTSPEVEALSVVINSIEIESPEITIPEDPIESLLDLVNMCSYPEAYTDLLLLVLGFEEAVDLASGDQGIPEMVPAYGEALQMCAVRGGHICTEDELNVAGFEAQPGQWAGGYGNDSQVVWMPGTRAYSSPYPPIEPNATNLFTFPRQVPVKVNPPVYPNGNFHCCEVKQLKLGKSGKLSIDKSNN